MDKLHNPHGLKPRHVSENIQQYSKRNGIEMWYSLQSREYNFSNELEMRYSPLSGEYNFSTKLEMQYSLHSGEYNFSIISSPNNKTNIDFCFRLIHGYCKLGEYNFSTSEDIVSTLTKVNICIILYVEVYPFHYKISHFFSSCKHTVDQKAIIMA